jgi:hypothetical protein
LREIGPCDVVVAYLDAVTPTGNMADGYPSYILNDVILRARRTNARCLRQLVRAQLGTSRTRIRIEEEWGLSDAHLIHMAEEERADLIVVGTHSRHGWSRLGHHSVSRGVLHYAPMNVACVPVGAMEQQNSDLPSLPSALAAAS